MDNLHMKVANLSALSTGRLYQQKTSVVFIYLITCLWNMGELKGIGICRQTWTSHYFSRKVWVPEFMDNRHMKVANLSALSTGRLCQQKISVVFIYLITCLWNMGELKGRGICRQTWTSHYFSRKVWLPEFMDNRHMKVANLSAPSTGRLYQQKTSVVFISVKVWVDLGAIMWRER